MLPKKYTIYHNPRCSKSRQCLTILNQNHIEVEVIEYLKTPPSIYQLEQLIDQLDIEIEHLLRKKEVQYKQYLQNQNLNRNQVLQVMIEHPILIERPIVSNGKCAIIGRPPEKVLSLLKENLL